MRLFATATTPKLEFSSTDLYCYFFRCFCTTTHTASRQQRVTVNFFPLPYEIFLFAFVAIAAVATAPTVVAVLFYLFLSLLLLYFYTAHGHSLFVYSPVFSFWWFSYLMTSAMRECAAQATTTAAAASVFLSRCSTRLHNFSPNFLFNHYSFITLLRLLYFQ